ncbi:GtrA family protein [Pseudomonas fakonensis]|uniref:Bactoprenol-linked glucose translocase n=1 Tax=Pseudomonas fakonensis TaxID=2842355 RepID=A0ABX8N7Q8_9PSED|nr:GtrA family protein [Pseudomonas fakonensis]QXH52389.1 GtrA family protein [Pseudomonas fakonensis]
MSVPRQLQRYSMIGVLNTLAHWLTFLLLSLVLGLNQALSNLLAFIVAASLSYSLNARYTFVVPPNRRRYAMFLCGMGSLSLAIGALADQVQLPPWLTLLVFTLVSLLVGYAFSHAVVFKRREP